MAVVGGTIAITYRSGDGDTGRADPDATTDDAPISDKPLAITNPPRIYRIAYRLEDLGRKPHRVTTVEVVVDRPYRSRRTVWHGDDTDSEPVQVSVSNFGLVSTRSQNSPDFTQAAVPAPPAGDLRLENAVVQLVAEGRLTLRERRTVLDTACQVYRTREPIGTGALLPPTDTEWTDVCIDRRGLALSEDWVLNGRLHQRQTASEVEIDPELASVPFAPFSQPVNPEISGAVRTVDPDSRPGFTFWELHGPPEGFAYRGRYEILTPSGAGDPNDPAGIGPPHSDIIDVYERGTNIVVISRGSIVGREQSFRGRPHGIDVDLGDLGVAEVETAVFGNWLRVKTDAVHFLSIRGTVTTDLLVDIARDLQASSGGELVYLDGPAS